MPLAARLRMTAVLLGRGSAVAANTRGARTKRRGSSAACGASRSHAELQFSQRARPGNSEDLNVVTSPEVPETYATDWRAVEAGHYRLTSRPSRLLAERWRGGSNGAVSLVDVTLNWWLPWASLLGLFARDFTRN
jgi:hypothetical protein